MILVYRVVTVLSPLIQDEDGKVPDTAIVIAKTITGASKGTIAAASAFMFAS